MFCSRSRRNPRQQVNEYATQSDFQEIFSEDMAGLHLLAYLLTADSDMAEQVFVAGLEDSIHGNPVFKQWARAWSKRAIIQSAIKAVAPTPARHGTNPETAETPWQNGFDVESIAAVVASWEPFERFVFVMAVLEGYGLRECAALLACPVQDVIAAKSSALQRLAAQSSTEVISPDREYIRSNNGFAQAQVA